ncbi:hypothetical protein REH65_33265 (plasmid) [Saccharopolyspora sp. ID03-671]|uniref:hypothetical protein n=1 Tax=Saccharopolyspora sp. ID03-671 TaxID=3073066 RepID=UPI0032514D84
MDAQDELARLRTKVQWLHDHLREEDTMSPEDRGRIEGARTAYASVLAMFDAAESGQQQPVPDSPPVLRLVADNTTDTRSRE